MVLGNKKIKRIFLLLLLQILFIPVFLLGQSKSEKYSNEAIEYFNKGMYDASIEKAELALELNSNNTVCYKILLAANVRLGNWKTAELYARKAISSDPNDSFTQYNYKLVKDKATEIKSSKVYSIVLILFYISLFVYTISRLLNKKFNLLNSNSSSYYLIIITGITSVAYFIFLSGATLIRSQNAFQEQDKITPIIRPWLTERDGLEGYSLFLISILTIFTSFLIIHLLKKQKFSKPVLIAVSCIGIVLSCLALFQIGIFPSMQSPANLRIALPIALSITILILILAVLSNKFDYISTIIIFLILIPICFLPVEGINYFDYSFILLPAYKILNGFSLKDIYFQYDLFLSLMAAGWIKSKLDIYSFQELGRIGYYVALILLFFFSKSLFKNKWLATLLVFSLAIVRIYGSMHDSVNEFQISPLRLDLWIILALLIYSKGYSHWSVGLFLGLLLVFHKNFGVLYLSAYLFYIVLITSSEIITNEAFNLSKLLGIIVGKVKLLWINFSLILISICASVALFGSFFPESAVIYQKIGIGMIPISKSSNYWLILIYISFLTLILFKNRIELGEKYFLTVQSIITFSIANSMYFFGRSHEHNLINISFIYIFLLYSLFDVLIYNYQTNIPKKNIIIICSFIFILSASYFYSARIKDKLLIQYENFKINRYIYLTPRPTDFSTIKLVTKRSQKVYFLSHYDDFQYYYFGGYKPEGYFSPYASWVIKGDLLEFLNSKLASGYYLIVPIGKPDESNSQANLYELNEILPNLKFKNREERDGYIFLFN